MNAINLHTIALGNSIRYQSIVPEDALKMGIFGVFRGQKVQS